MFKNDKFLSNLAGTVLMAGVVWAVLTAAGPQLTPTQRWAVTFGSWDGAPPLVPDTIDQQIRSGGTAPMTFREYRLSSPSRRGGPDRSECDLIWGKGNLPTSSEFRQVFGEPVEETEDLSGNPWKARYVTPRPGGTTAAEDLAELTKAARRREGFR